MSGMKKRVRMIEQALEEFGAWEIALTKRSHYKCTHVVTGAIVFVASSSGDANHLKFIRRDARIAIEKKRSSQ